MKPDFDLSIIYYTANFAHQAFVERTQAQLLRAIDQDYPIISVSQKPMDFGKNICLGDIGRSHLNIYRQILRGAKEATTKYVAMAEDDILYSYEHFHTQLPQDGKFLYDMSKVSLFTWTKPPMFSFRTKRRVINQLIAPRELLIEALEERFARVEKLMADGMPEERIIKYWGDIGRYEGILGVTVRDVEEFYCSCPSIVFSHEEAFGYLSQGKRKRLGDIKIIELADWGRAEDVLKVYTEP